MPTAEPDPSLPSAILDEGAEGSLPLVDVREQDLFKRVGEKVNRDFIRGLLAEYKPQFTDDIQLDGSLADLVAELRNAVTLGRIPRERALGLLQEFEENGNQTLLYYAPTSDQVIQTCRKPEEIAARLFGQDWQAGF